MSLLPGEMSAELQARLKALQEHMAAAMAEQEVKAARIRGEEVARAEEPGGGTRAHEGEQALLARGAELKGSMKGGAGRPAMDGAF
jgi:hypothetical protein